MSRSNTPAAHPLYHGLWIGWSILGCGWISFAHIAWKTRQVKWFVESGVYFATMVALFMLVHTPEGQPLTRVENITIGIYVLGWLVSMVRAFMVRPEYVLRLAAMQQRDLTAERQLERRIEQEYDVTLSQRPAGNVRGDAPRSRRAFGEGSLRAATNARPAWPRETLLPRLQREAFLHLVAKGAALDATDEHADLADLMAWAEKEGFTAIDVGHAAVRLTPEGEHTHERTLRDARDVVRRYDVFGDVEPDTPKGPRFGSGLGSDLRVPIYELEGLDPYHVRFLVGLADGEWNGLPRWWAAITRASWYDEVFAVVTNAPTVDEIGRERLEAIRAAGKALLAEA